MIAHRDFYGQINTMPHEIPASPASVNDWLYLETINDLQRRTVSLEAANRYELLGIAAMLRKLLLDGTSLLDEVNRIDRLRLRFSVIPFPITSPTERKDEVRGTYWMVPLLILGKRELFDPASDGVPLKSFLSAAVGQFEQHAISARDLIQYYANVEGGVHRGHASGDFQTVMGAIASLDLTLSTGWLESLGWLARITLHGLQPLTDAVQSRWIEPEPSDKRLARIMMRNSVPHAPAEWWRDIPHRR